MAFMIHGLSARYTDFILGSPEQRSMPFILLFSRATCFASLELVVSILDPTSKVAHLIVSIEDVLVSMRDIYYCFGSGKI